MQSSNYSIMCRSKRKREKGLSPMVKIGEKEGNIYTGIDVWCLIYHPDNYSEEKSKRVTYIGST